MITKNGNKWKQEEVKLQELSGREILYKIITEYREQIKLPKR